MNEGVDHPELKRHPPHQKFIGNRNHQSFIELLLQHFCGQWSWTTAFFPKLEAVHLHVIQSDTSSSSAQDITRQISPGRRLPVVPAGLFWQVHVEQVASTWDSPSCCWVEVAGKAGRVGASSPVNHCKDHAHLLSNVEALGKGEVDHAPNRQESVCVQSPMSDSIRKIPSSSPEVEAHEELASVQFAGLLPFHVISQHGHVTFVRCDSSKIMGVCRYLFFTLQQAFRTPSRATPLWVAIPVVTLRWKNLLMLESQGKWVVLDCESEEVCAQQ